MTENAFSELPLLIADLYQAAGAMRAVGERVASGTGQTQARWQVLSVFSTGDLTVAQGARRLGVARQGVQRIVNELLSEGLVVDESNPRHRRSAVIQLTDTGLATLAEITRAAEGWHRLAVRELGSDEILTARRVLRRLISAAADQEEASNPPASKRGRPPGGRSARSAMR